MRVFRLSKREYAVPLSGKGAAKYGNRWNSKGVEMIYTSESRALAMAEVVVHLSLANLPNDFVMMEIDIPTSVEIEVTELETLSPNWNNNPYVLESQLLGDSFIEKGRSCVLKVPSAVVKGDFNFLINPHHLDFSAIKVEEITDFPLDTRIYV